MRGRPSEVAWREVLPDVRKHRQSFLVRSVQSSVLISPRSTQYSETGAKVLPFQLGIQVLPQELHGQSEGLLLGGREEG